MTKRVLRWLVSALVVLAGALILLSTVRTDLVMMTAARHGSVPVVKLLLAAGADVDIRGSIKRTPLHKAAYYGQTKVIDVLVAAGADVNAKDSGGQIPLHEAAYGSRTEAIKTLIAAGGDVNAKDSRGRTPLHEAAYGSEREAIEALIVAGADAKARDARGVNPLHIAAWSGHEGMIKVLLAAAVDVDDKDNEGRTPLHRAAVRDSLEATQALVQAGADLAAKDLRGRTALAWAEELGNGDVAAFLRTHDPSRTVTREGKADEKKSERCKALATKAVNAFGMTLYAKLNKGDRNLVFSPFSVFLPMAIASEGARGRTKEEMTRVLAVDRLDVPLQDTVKTLIHDLLDSVRGNQGELEIANGLWVQQSKDYTINRAFEKIALTDYDASIRQCDFLSAPGKVSQEINRWLDEKTHGRIRDMVSGDDLSQKILAIVNAIYFKSMWQMPFEPAKTKDAPFTLSNGSQIKVPMMHKTSLKYHYLEERSFQALELPYRGWMLSMVIFLPRESNGLAEFERSLTPEKLSIWLGKLSRWRDGVEVSFPRFTMRSRLDLVPTLGNMGMEHALDRSADFSGIFEPIRPGLSNQELFIQKVFHEARIAVSEKGTEAAAGSFLGLGFGKSVPKVFRADHPFMFIIYHKLSKCILFVGRVTNPVEKAR